MELVFPRTVCICGPLPNRICVTLGSPIFRLNVGYFTAVPSVQAVLQRDRAHQADTQRSRSPPLYFSFCVERRGGREASAYLLN